MDTVVYTRQPTFASESCISLHMTHGKARLGVSCEPSFSCAGVNIEADVDPIRAKAIFSILFSQSYRPEIGSVGLDGTTYALKLESGNTGLTLHWWEKLPQPWHPLQKALEMLEELEMEVRAQHHLPPLDRGEGGG